jgi:RNA polymerase-binding transcription factor DksA
MIYIIFFKNIYMPNKSQLIMNENKHEKNREMLLKINQTILQLLNVLNEVDSKQKTLISDMESVKSYINQLKIRDDKRRKEVQKEIEEADKNINNGWWFGY